MHLGGLVILPRPTFENTGCTVTVIFPGICRSETDTCSCLGHINTNYLEDNFVECFFQNITLQYPIHLMAKSLIP